MADFAEMSVLEICVGRLMPIRFGGGVVLRRLLLLTMGGCAFAITPFSQTIAQEVEHARIEALFLILGSDEAVAPPNALGVSGIPAAGLTQPPQHPGSPFANENVGSIGMDTVFPSARPDGKGCPEEVSAFSGAVEDVEASAADFARRLGKIEERFDAVSDAMMEMRGSGGFTCQVWFRASTICLRDWTSSK